MSESYLAFDLGAESGRALLGTVGDAGRLEIRELHRFSNGAVDILGHLHWNVLGLYREAARDRAARSA